MANSVADAAQRGRAHPNPEPTGLEAARPIIGTMSSAPTTLPQSAGRLLSPETLPDQRELVLRVMPLPSDVNANGDIFGGWLMAQVDMAGAVLPYRIARGRIATVAVNEFLFKQAVSIGDLLSFYARVERVGNTSITVHVEVFAERNPVNPQVVKVTEARITYVAIDKDGKPRPIPKPEA
jgi:acyl-CoA thioesterase YciA